jgi:membrane fusion protein (multidrug efflux system)
MLVSAWSSSAEEDQLSVLRKNYSTNNLSSSTSIRGQLRPVNHTVLSAGIDGKLSKFDVRNGSTIKKGELIARFSCEHQEAEHKIASARVVLAEKNFEISQKLDTYKNISELDLSISEADFEIATAEVLRTLAILKQCDIRSPYDATVTEKHVQAYQYVKKGDPLLEIVDTQNLEIEMVLPSLNITQYVEGAAFSLIVDETGQEFSAEIDRVVNVIDPVSQTVRVIGKPLGARMGLMPGMSGVVRFAE